MSCMVSIIWFLLTYRANTSSVFNVIFRSCYFNDILILHSAALLFLNTDIFVEKKNFLL